jgi:hypothetical protein
LPEEVDLKSESQVLRVGQQQSTSGSNSVRVALSGVSDARRLTRVVAADSDTTRLFPRFAKLVRAWAQANGIYSAQFGFLGGFGWAVVALRFLRQHKVRREAIVSFCCSMVVRIRIC